MAKKSRIRGGSQEMVVTLDETHTSSAAMAKVVAALRKAGVEVEEAMGELGMVTCRASAEQAAAIRKMEGVSGVLVQGTIDIGPPDSDVQ